MREKLSIEVVKHSDSEYRVIIENPGWTTRIIFSNKKEAMAFLRGEILKADVFHI